MKISPKVIQIIESMNFTEMGNEYVGTFISDNSGDVIDIIVKYQDSNTCELPKLEFHAFVRDSDEVEPISILLLDQMMTAYDTDLHPIPHKTKNKYSVSCTVEMEFTVDMSKVSTDEYIENCVLGTCPGNACTENSVARSIACSKIQSMFKDTQFNETCIKVELCRIIEE